MRTVHSEIHQTNENCDTLIVAAKDNENIDTVLISYYQGMEAYNRDYADFRLQLTYEFIKEIMHTFINRL